MSVATVRVALILDTRIGKVVPVGTFAKVIEVPESAILTVTAPPFPTSMARVTSAKSVESEGVTNTALVIGLMSVVWNLEKLSVAGITHYLTICCRKATRSR